MFIPRALKAGWVDSNKWSSNYTLADGELGYFDAPRGRVCFMTQGLGRISDFGQGVTWMKPRDRNAHIDFLRGIAISLVLLLHFALAYGLANCPLSPFVSQNILKAVFLNGNYGVTMFFVISGYLITSMSLARWGEPARISARSFYIYRFARIMPSLILALAIIVSLGLLEVPFFMNKQHGESMSDSFFLVATFSVLTFWHNVLMQSIGWFNYCLNIYWSLSVEEVFYLALPLVFLGLRRRWLLLACCFVLIAVGPIYRSIHFDDELFYECGYFANFDAIAMGCLVAMLQSRLKTEGFKGTLLRVAAGIGLVVFYLRGIEGNQVWGFSLVAFSAGLYLVGAVNEQKPSFATGRTTAFLRWLGRHSYELYLFHIIVLAALRNIWTKQTLPAALWLPWFALFIAASVVLAMLVARFVSEPANRAIRDRLLPGSRLVTHGA
jgi:peptidoglycan/LPS O-acetylase OafA/YrhL